VNRIDHLATAAETYAVGSYLLLSFGRGTQVCHIEGETKARYIIRRFENRNTDRAAWAPTTSKISKSDDRIRGAIVAEKLVVANVTAAVEAEDMPAVEAPELPEVAPAVVAKRARDAAAQPTTQQYGELSAAFDFFNDTLFYGALPRCLITMQRHAKMFGYFHAERFTDGVAIADEIALNPEHMAERPVEASLGTLVHEMVHLWDHHHGKPARGGYHSKTWAAKMEEVGLIPSSTGAPGGKKTGQKVSHYIAEGGPFARHCAELIAAGWKMPYVQTPTATKETKAKKASKTKFTCPCCQANAWAKPVSKLICGECEEPMVPETAEEVEA
jgi:predicted SprT family Zn-dependent metalloprotease